MIFVTDHIFLRYENKIYSNKFSYEVFNRYIGVFEEITIIGRLRDVTTTEGRALCSGAKIKFEFMQNISNLKSFFGPRKSVRKKIEKILDQHDSMIARIPSQLGFLAIDIARTNKKIWN